MLRKVTVWPKTTLNIPNSVTTGDIAIWEENNTVVEHLLKISNWILINNTETSLPMALCCNDITCPYEFKRTHYKIKQKQSWQLMAWTGNTVSHAEGQRDDFHMSHTSCDPHHQRNVIGLATKEQVLILGIIWMQVSVSPVWMLWEDSGNPMEFECMHRWNCY